MTRQVAMQNRNGRWYFYRTVPKDVRAFYGHDVMKTSLGTDSYKKACAPAATLYKKSSELFNRVRNAHKMASDFTGISIQALQTMSASEFADLLEDRRLGYASKVDEIERSATGAKEKLGEVFGHDVAESVFLASDIGKNYQKDLAEAQRPIRDIENIILVLEGSVPAAHDFTPKFKVSRERTGLDDIFDVWVSRNKPRQNTVNEAAMSLRQFKEVNGDIDIHLVTKEHVRAYREAILRLPKHVNTRGGRKTVPQILEACEGTDYESISLTTAKKRLSFVKTLLSLAAEEGVIESDPSDGVKITSPVAMVNRLPFTKDELRSIFSASPFIMDGKRDATFWLPLLALFTGARAGELLQIEACDVMCEDGIWFLNIVDDNGKKLKTEDSRRRIPVHRALRDLGFIGYAKSAEGRVFSDIPYGKVQVSAVWSKVFMKWLRQTVGITDPRKTLHSFRHSFKNLCREAWIPEDVHDALTGHWNPSCGRGYGDMPLKTLYEAIEKIECPIPLNFTKASSVDSGTRDFLLVA